MSRLLKGLAAAAALVWAGSAQAAVMNISFTAGLWGPFYIPQFDESIYGQLRSVTVDTTYQVYAGGTFYGETPTTVILQSGGSGSSRISPQRDLYYYGSVASDPNGSVSVLLQSSARSTFRIGDDLSMFTSSVDADRTLDLIVYAFTHGQASTWGTFEPYYSTGTAKFDIEYYYGDFGVPEPATWAMMLAGFGLIGGAMRRIKPAPIPAQ